MTPALKTFIVRNFLNYENPKYPKMLILKGDHQSGEILALDCYEKSFIDFFLKNLETMRPNSRNEIMLDIGASYGTYCLNLAAFFKEVVAFEPGSTSHKILDCNCKINNINNIRIENVGLADFEGDAKIVVPKNDNGSAYILRETDEKEIDSALNNIYKVKVKNLDNYINQQENSDDFRVGLIKIDAEGLEAEILKSSKQTIIHNNPIILFESHGKVMYERVRKVLNGYGYNHFYKITQSRRIWKNRLMNLLEFLFRPNFLKIEKISQAKDVNYQVVVASVNPIDFEKRK